jgi:hypothetical protein
VDHRGSIDRSPLRGQGPAWTIAVLSIGDRYAAQGPAWTIAVLSIGHRYAVSRSIPYWLT